MTLKTHVFLATVTTAAIIALIYVRSNSSDDSRLRKVMEKTKDIQTNIADKPVSEPEAPKPDVSKPKAPKEEIPEVELPVQSEEPQKTQKLAPAENIAKQPEKETEQLPDDFLIKENVVKNGSFKEGLSSWRYWRIDEKKGKQFIKADNSTLSIQGQLNTLMGVAQSVKVSSGTVYRLCAKVRSVGDSETKGFLGARLALYADGQKEQQVVWLYKNKDWEEKELVFTNRYSGLATLFFHTGYTTNAVCCTVKDISLAPENPFPRKNICSFNGDFKDGTKGWNFWQIPAAEASNLITRVSGDWGECVEVKGQADNRLMGMSQAVNVVSGAVYRLSASVRSQDEKEKTLFGARVALYAPGQKESQLLWTYNTKGWENKTLIFTNSYSGAATLYFHTGYTTNSCTALFKDLSLVRRK